MFISEKYIHHLPSPFRFSPSKKPINPYSLSRSFEESLAARLRSLLPLPESTSIPLSWLSRAVDIISITFSDANSILLSVASSSDRAAVEAYLSSGVALLDASNAIAAEIDCFLRSLLHLRYALHILSEKDSSATPDRLKRARDSIAEWKRSPRRGVLSSAGAILRSLVPAVPPLGKMSSAIRRTIYALEAVSSLIAGAVVAVLGGGELPVVTGVVPGEFPWAEGYHDVAATVSAKLGGCDRSAAEVEAVEAAVEKLTNVIDKPRSGDDVERSEQLKKTVEETEKAVGELTDGFDLLSNAFNGLFRAAMGTRNTALQSYRIAPQKCK